MSYEQQAAFVLNKLLGLPSDSTEANAYKAILETIEFLIAYQNKAPSEKR